MKKLIKLSLTLLAIILPAVTAAHDFETGGIYYNIVDGEAIVTFRGTSYSSYNEYRGDEVIPATIIYNGTTYPVTKISENAFRNCVNLNSVTIGENVTVISDFAFCSCQNMTNVSFPNSLISIGSQAFNGCYALETLSIPNSVTSIGDHAFYWCEGLKSIELPNALTSIGENTFFYCLSLTNVTIPNSVISIGQDAFYYCTSLTSINIPNSVTSIGESAFCDCTSLANATIGNSVTTIGEGAFSGCSALTSVSIPSSVTSIGSGAFDNCTGMTRVNTSDIAAWCNISFSNTTANPLNFAHHLYLNGSEVTDLVIPNTVTNISNFAFYSCTGLKSVATGNSVYSIGNNAFFGCTGLETVTIGNSVNTIGINAFFKCTGLEDVTIGSSVTSIYNNAFYNCTGLTRVNISDITAWCNVNFGTASSNPLYLAHHLYLNGSEITDLVIPNTVTNISDYTFYGCTGLTSLTTGNSLNTIGNNAFSACTGLETVTIGNSVNTIGYSAFYNCSGLTNLSIGNAVTTINNNSSFYGCSGLENISVASDNPNFDSRYNCNAIIETATNTLIVGSNQTVIPNGVTTIGYSAFQGRTGLTSIDIPSTVTTIRNSAFRDCINLSDVNIPNSVTFIGMYAFDNTAWMNAQTEGLIYAGQVAYKYLGTMPEGTEITLREGTTGIASGAFYECTGLTSINMPNTLTTIGDYAFCGCTGLTNVDIPNSVTSIGSDAFERCTALTSVTLPNSITSISSNMFLDCTGLTSIIIPKSITTIGSSAFGRCTSLTDIEIPYSVTTIGNSAFYGCTGLTSVVIPYSVTTIDSYAFSGCTGLTSVVIPYFVTTIGNCAFENCDALREVNCRIPDPSQITMGENVFYTTVNSGLSEWESNYVYRLLYVREGTVGAYQADPKWSEFFKYVNENSHYADFDIDGIYYNITGNDVKVTYRGDDSNSYPDEYTGDVTIPATVTCNGNTYAVTEIGYEAFYGCTGLTSVDIPNSITSIGSYAFYNCKALKGSLKIPASVTSIGTRAFNKCPLITEVTSLNTEPPVCSQELFNDNVYIHSTLYVPKESVMKYITSDGWGPFIHIIGIETSDMVLATSVKLNHPQVHIAVGANTQLAATVLPDSTTIKAVNWACSNSAVATVDDNGLVTAVAPGTATVTAMTTDGSNLSASCIVGVYEDVSQFSDYLSIADTAVIRGNTVIIPVKMTNAANIIAFQTDLTLPEGLELAVDEDDDYLIDPSSRMTTSHNLSSNNVTGGAIRIFCYSTKNKPFTGNSGDDLFYLHVKTTDDALGDYTVKMSNSLLTTNTFEEIFAPDVTANLHVNACPPGDVNGSGTVTVTDVVYTSMYILEQNPQPFFFDAADLNQDGYVTVTDVARIVYLILNPTQHAPRHAPALMPVTDSMSAEGIALSAGETRTVSIALDNTMNYTGFQVDLHLPDGMTVGNFRLTDRAASHTFNVNTLKSGDIRALCYSPALEGISGHEGALLTFDVTASSNIMDDITVDGIELVTTDCQTVKLDAFTIGVNNVTAVSELTAGKPVVKVEYYNLAGQQMQEPASGVTLVITTYSDGTRTTTKVIR